uniref:Nucleotide exchange factor SIL1 n=1 Tax=Corethrella appendiculata TaxID=1370023 RepID=U5EHJ2_9DIPT
MALSKTFSLIVFMIVFNLIKSCYCNDTFVPTKEWQTIKEGQEIPPGLHVRINLQTGLKEAKILDETDEKQSSSAIMKSSTADGETNENSKLNKLDEIKDSIKNIPGTEFNLSESDIDKIKNKYKSYEKIKKELNEANMNIKTDAEIINDLFENYQKILHQTPTDANENELLEIFNDFEYFAHQIDNSLYFIDNGGLEKIVFPNIINQTNFQLRISALKLLGALAQNNPKAKVAIFEKNAGVILINLLSHTKQSKEISTAIYSLSSFLRNFPFAQKEILSNARFEILLDLLAKSDIDISNKIRVIIFLSDLFVEYNDAIRSEKDAMKLKQYKDSDTENKLSKFNYCEIVNDFVTNNRKEIVKTIENAEKLISSLENSKMCLDIWSECPMLRHTLLVIKNHLNSEIEENIDNQYLNEIHNRFDLFVKEIYIDTNELKLVQKDEL